MPVSDLSTDVKVMFRRGLQENIPSSGATDGAFYLTTDTHRLYVGNSSGTCDLLSQAVVTVANVAALSTYPKVEGQFYYAISENVLCTVSGNQYIQINPDTYTTATKVVVGTVVGGNGAKITIGLESSDSSKDIYSNDAGNISATFTGAGDAYITPTASVDEGAGSIEVYSSPYTLDGSAAISSGQKTWSLKKTAKDGTVTSAGDIKIEAGSNISLSETNGIVTITGAAASDISVLKRDSLQIENSSTAGFDVTITDASNASTIDNLDPIVKVGNDNATNKALSGAQQIHFINGISDLPVYTMKQVDDLFKVANAMTYRGTVATKAALDAETVHNGDTWLASADIVQLNAKKGDLIIAQGNEGDGGTISSPTWQVVESGNDIDTQYAFKPYPDNIPGIVLYETTGNEGDTGSLEIKIAAGDNWLDVRNTGSEGANQKAVFEHKTLANSAAASEDSTKDVTVSNGGIALKDTFTAVTSLVADAAGHITGWKTSEFTVSDTILSNINSSLTITPTTIDTNDAKITIGLTVADTSETKVTKSAEVNFRSSSIKFSASSNNITADLVWGTF